jgi:hypothetical protein
MNTVKEPNGKVEEKRKGHVGLGACQVCWPPMNFIEPMKVKNFPVLQYRTNNKYGAKTLIALMVDLDFFVLIKYHVILIRKY